MAPYAEIRSFDQWKLLLNMKKVFRFELFKPNVFDTYQKKGDFDYDFSIPRGCIFRLLRDYSKNFYTKSHFTNVHKCPDSRRYFLEVKNKLFL